MKAKLFLLTLVISFLGLKAQTIPFNYSVKVVPVTVPGFPGLHSFASAQSGGKWLLIGGRKDGLHARQPFSSFPAAQNNTDIYVVDMNTKQLWQSSVNVLPIGLKEQLQSTNMNFYQDADTLYIIGGYGYSNTAVDHITFPNLTSVSVSGLINAITNSLSISPFFKQVIDQRFAVNGGQMGKIGNDFYLVGGHRFDGRYNPMGNPTYTQTYVDGMKKFNLLNQGVSITVNNYTVITDQVHLHRRDYNLVPQVFPDGSLGYSISSGVFQVGIDLPFLYPVDIKSSGYFPQTAFNQYLSNYHSAKLAVYDSLSNVMHSFFFGGLSQYYYNGTTLIQDNNVPFVKTISRVSRDAGGNLQEVVFPNEMPALIGASAEFIYNHSVPHYSNEVVKLSQITADSVLVGHIVGGIHSPQLNPFTNNNTGVTSAHNVFYEVWLVKNAISGIQEVNGKNPVKLNVFPNPGSENMSVNIVAPYDGSLDLFVTDINGKLVKDVFVGKITKGFGSYKLEDVSGLANGTYMFNFVFDGHFSVVEKVIIDK